METLAEWRALITSILHEYTEYPPSHGEIQTEVIVDERLDHYEMIQAGWSGKYRIHGSVIHIDIRDGKIVIQHDGTEEGIAERLVEAGIPQDKIVLAYKHPFLRLDTGFAVA